MKRRNFLSFTFFSALLVLYRDAFGHNSKEGYVMTVRGKMPVSKLGRTLPHEHIVTDFSGAELPDAVYKNEEAILKFLPLLMKLKSTGVNTIFECTPSYIGKNVALLHLLSSKGGLNIVTNTGYYAASGQKYLPKHAFTETAEQLASRWISDYENGIEGTEIKPGFIKIGTDDAPLHDVSVKLVRAAGFAHLHTGLKIAIHSGSGAAALEEVSILESIGVSPAAMIWVHAQNNSSGEIHVQLAKRGCWVSLDGINEKPVVMASYSEMIRKMKSANLLGRLLISHDDGFAVNMQNSLANFEAYQNGNNQPYVSIMTKFRPVLLNGVLSSAEFDRITIDNPAEAFKIEKL